MRGAGGGGGVISGGGGGGVRMRARKCAFYI